MKKLGIGCGGCLLVVLLLSAGVLASSWVFATLNSISRSDGFGVGPLRIEVANPTPAWSGPASGSYVAPTAPAAAAAAPAATVAPEERGFSGWLNGLTRDCNGGQIAAEVCLIVGGKELCSAIDVAGRGYMIDVRKVPAGIYRLVATATATDGGQSERIVQIDPTGVNRVDFTDEFCISSGE